MAAELETRRCGAAGARAIYDTLLAVYVEVYAGEDRDFFRAPRYRQQLDSHLQVPGFELVTGSLKGEVVGYAYGFPLPPGSGWWKGLQTPAPDDLAREAARTFAVSEVMVRQPWRRQGIARRLHDELLAGRGEERATLLVEPENAPAQAAYAQWGWRRIGELRPSWPDAPLYDALILTLRD